MQGRMYTAVFQGVAVSVEAALPWLYLRGISSGTVRAARGRETVGRGV
jgi:hypothetical protein